jgi:hypothetical protein
MHGVNIKIIILYMSTYVIMVTTMHYHQQKCPNTNMIYIFVACGLKSLYVVLIMSYEEWKLFDRSQCLKTRQTLGNLRKCSGTGLPTDQAWKT